MDQLDRLYRTLVQTIRASFPQYLSQPFEVAELYQTILPYRHHRRTLGFETNQDYEVALLELLSGERGYLLVDERMRDALRREIATPNPDPAVFRQFAGSQVSLAHEPLRQAEDSEQLVGAFARHRRLDVADKLGDDDILARSEFRQKVMELVNEAEEVAPQPRAAVIVKLGSLLPVEADRTFKAAL